MALRGEHHVAQFPGRAVATAQGAAPVGVLQDPAMGIGGRGGEPRFAHHDEVGEVIAHEAHLLHRKMSLLRKLAYELALVADFGMAGHAKFGGAARELCDLVLAAQGRLEAYRQ